MKKLVANISLILHYKKSKAMNTNTQFCCDPGNGGCCGGGITEIGCC